MLKKILVVIGIITVWECRESIIPAIEKVYITVTNTVHRHT